MRPFEWYNLNVYHEIGSRENCILVEKRKKSFIGLNFNYWLQNPIFLGKNFGGTRHPCEKNEPTLDHSGGGGVHGKACWLIAYNLIYTNHFNLLLCLASDRVIIKCRALIFYRYLFKH